MKRINVLSVAVSLFVALVHFDVSAQVAQTYKGEAIAPYKVRFKLDASSSQQMKSALADRRNVNGFLTKGVQEAYLKTGMQTLDKLNARFGTQDMKRVFRYAGKHEWKHVEAGLDRWYEITVDSREDMEGIVEAYQGVGHIEVAEPVYKRYLKSVEGSEDLSYIGSEGMEEEVLADANDPRLGDMYGLGIINAPEAWDIETGSKNVIVAIEDQGVDYRHEDLAGNMWINEDEVPGNNKDDDNNGYVDDYYGYNFGNDRGDIAIGSHGTHVGGTVAAETNNGIGVAGIAGGFGNDDGVRLMSLSVFGDNRQGGFDEAFVYAADNGAVISQNSWGGGGQSSALEDAIDYFTEKSGGAGAPMEGGLVVFAAGNDDSSSPSVGYPASYPITLAVASITSSRKKSSFSNYGSWVDISAPGSSILSCYPNNRYNSISGTSMACPHVSGVAALVVSAYEGNITTAKLREILESTASDVDSYNPSYKGKMGKGIVDAFAALKDTGDPPSGCTDPISSFPYGESFESDLGKWKQANGDDLNWDRDSGGTPSSGTGPENAADGSYYLYVEASGEGTGYPNKRALLESPCFDISSLSSPALKFSYHMKGTDMGSLTLEGSTDDGQTWTDLWTKSGSQGDSWNEAEVTLSGGVVKLRFNAVTGGGWSSDIAIDKVIVDNGDGGGGDPVYCDSKGGGGYEYIAGVSVGSMNNTSGESDYTDFTNITAEVVPGATVTLVPGFTGSSYTEHWSVWIDFNKDGDFEDSDEQVFTGQGSADVSGTLTIPSSATGTTRMRVSLKYGGTPPSCGNFDGETEDYTVTLGSGRNVIFEGRVAIEETPSFELYPNPAASFVTISLQKGKKAKVQIIDTKGMLLREFSIEGSSKVDIADIPQGIYMISIDSGVDKYTGRLLKK